MVSGNCPRCGKCWGGTPEGHYGYVVTLCSECQSKDIKFDLSKIKKIKTKETSR